jgi:hypothetical protein
VYAGAVREAVFSNPDVIRRVNAEFVPVSLKTDLVKKPPDDEEGQLYREIGRSRLWHQGICVLNSAGKVLAWTIGFDDDQSVLSFLDYSKKRFGQFPDATKPVAVERFQKFPSAKDADVPDNGKTLVILDHHPEGKPCPGAPRRRKGTVLARVVGRALDKDGTPVADTVPQENYVEDRFYIPVGVQEAFARSLADAGTKAFRLADDLSRLLVSHAFLGQLDVNPLGGYGGKGGLTQCAFWGQKVEADGKGPTRVRLVGESEAGARTSASGRLGDRAFWLHEVKLAWEGLIDLDGKRMTQLLLLARGNEKLEWDNQYLPGMKGQADVTVLVGGHTIKLDCGVRYGIIGEPVADGEERPQQVSAAARQQLTEMLGPVFLVFHDKVQADLQLLPEQRTKLENQLQDRAEDAEQLFHELGGKEPQDLERELQAYRGKAQENVWAFLKEVLQEGQFNRLRQVMLQWDPLSALFGNAEVAKELQITALQRQQFAQVAQEVQNQFEPSLREAQQGGKREAMPPLMKKVRKEQVDRIEGLLSEAQKQRWKELLGKPLDLGD